MHRKTEIKTRVLLAAALLCPTPTSVASAASPAEILPEAMYATGEGCKALETALPEDIEVMDFLVMSNTELIGQEVGCSFVEAEEGKTQAGKVWWVKAKCGSAEPGEDAAITIRELGDGQLEVAMTIEGEEPDILGTFTYCPKVLTD